MKAFRHGALTALIASTGFVAPAAFAGEAVAPSTSVVVGDLNLYDPDSQKMVERRIESAAREVCGAGRTQSLRETPAQRQCRKIAMESTRTQVAALYSNRAFAAAEQ